MLYAISKNGLRELVQSEGIELYAYRDTAGKLTVGVGHLLTQSELMSGKIHLYEHARYLGVARWRDGITYDQAMLILARDTDIAESAINRLVIVDLSQEQFDALVSFVFNVGAEAFEHSTLLKKLNRAQYHDAADEFDQWIYSGGEITAGLIKRRKREKSLFLSSSIA